MTRPYQAADVYNATRDKALYEWVAALEARIEEMEERQTELDEQHERDLAEVVGLQARLSRYEKALRGISETDLTYGDMRGHANFMRKTALSALTEAKP
jgi:hypothetical protein